MMTDNASLERDVRSSTFVMVYEDVWQALLYDPTALVVFMAITRRTHEGNRSWYGKKKTLAAESGVSVATFERKVKVLEERGLVTVTRQYRNPETNEISRTKGGGFTEQIQNIYTVSEHTPEWYESIAKSAGVTSQRGGVTSQRGDTSPHEEVGVTSQRGPNIDPLHKSQTQITNQSASGDAPRPQTYSDEFEEFWKIYPRKTDKIQAQERFDEQLEATDYDTLMAAVKNFRAETDRLGTEQRYMPMCKTWLNQQRWRDFLNASPTHQPTKDDVLGWNYNDIRPNQDQEDDDELPF